MIKQCQHHALQSPMVRKPPQPEQLTASQLQYVNEVQVSYVDTQCLVVAEKKIFFFFFQGIDLTLTTQHMLTSGLYDMVSEYILLQLLNLYSGAPNSIRAVTPLLPLHYQVLLCTYTFARACNFLLPCV